MTEIPFLDLSRLHRELAGEFHLALDVLLESNTFVGAEASRSFEMAFAALHSRRGGVGCGSGTDALVLALRALGLQPRDEVVVPAMTFVATAEAVVLAGALPVLADVDSESLLLTEEAVAAVRTKRTRAVIPVHLYGHVVPFSRLRNWKAEGLFVVEDAAQAHLARDGTEQIGSASDLACFSFYPGKNLGALGDGGMVLGDDESLLEHMRRLRDHGSTRRYLHEEIGLCSRLDGFQAAALQIKLGHLARWHAARREVACRYRELLAVSDPGCVRIVPFLEHDAHHVVAIRVPANRRDDVRQRLSSDGIGTGIHYPFALSEQPSLSPYRRRYPRAERAARELISLPVDPLMQLEEVDRVVAMLMRALKTTAPTS